MARRTTTTVRLPEPPRSHLLLWSVLACLALGGAFYLSHLPARERLQHAQAGYRAAQRQYEQVAAQRVDLENRLASLQKSVSAVELQARIEYRLIYPGERLEVVREVTPQPSDVTPLVASGPAVE